MKNYKKYIITIMATGMIMGMPEYEILAQQYQEAVETGEFYEVNADKEYIKFKNGRTIHSGEMGCGMDLTEFASENSIDMSKFEKLSKAGITLDDDQLTSTSPFTPLTYIHEKKFAGSTIFNGIDVSHWQGDIDWKAVHEGGVDFAIIRVGHRNGGTGVIEEDKKYAENFKNAVKNNVNIGAYIYSQAITEKEAREEAKYILKRIKKYDITLPVVFDYEYDSSQPDGGRLKKANLSQKKASKIALAFCDVVREAGYEPMIYGNASFMTAQLSEKYLGDKNLFWQARYSTTTKPEGGYVIYNGPYDFWQYSSTGHVEGINTYIDCDFWYLDLTKKMKAPEVFESYATYASLCWNKKPLVTGYEVLRYVPEEEKYVVAGRTSSDMFEDMDLEPSRIYNYKVRPYWKIGGKKYTGKSSSGCEVVTSPAKVTEVAVNGYKSTSVEISWKKQSRVSGYVLYLYNNELKKYEKYGSVKSDTTSFKFENLKPATEYRFYVKAFLKNDGEYYYGKHSDVVSTVTKPGSVKNISVQKRTKNAITLSWKKVSGCTGYYVYRYDKKTGKYEKLSKLKNSKSPVFTDSKLKKNKKYQYKICAYKKIDDKIYKGSLSAEIIAKTKK